MSLWLGTALVAGACGWALNTDISANGGVHVVFAVHPITIDEEADGAASVLAVDVDHDGDLDVLSASFRNDTIALFENDGQQGFTFHVITMDAEFVQSVVAADVDGDGDLDVLPATENAGAILWYKNDGSQIFTPQSISPEHGARAVFAADADGDGDLDILASARESVAWYENDGYQTFTTHEIETPADFATGLLAADVDSDGDLDLLSATGSEIAWFEHASLETVVGNSEAEVAPILSPGTGMAHRDENARYVEADQSVKLGASPVEIDAFPRHLRWILPLVDGSSTKRELLPVPFRPESRMPREMWDEFAQFGKAEAVEQLAVAVLRGERDEITYLAPSAHVSIGVARILVSRCGLG